MKNIFKFSLMLGLVALSAACSDDDAALPQTHYATYSEDFGTYDAETNTYSFNLTEKGWTTYAEAGTKNWFINDYAGNVYMEFSSYNSGNNSNVGWLITPKVNIDQTSLKRMSFLAAQHHASSLDNTFELLVSDDFDGENVQLATWKKKTFRVPAYNSATNYDFFTSGGVDLSEFSGDIYVAFKITGNGTTQTGGFQIDNVNFF